MKDNKWKDYKEFIDYCERQKAHEERFESIWKYRDIEDKIREDAEIAQHEKNELIKIIVAIIFASLIGAFCCAI